MNNFSDVEYEEIKAVECEYLVIGRETGESGTPHLQGYIEFGGRIRGTKLKGFPGFSRAHIERRKGTSTQASVYCQKDGITFEKGTISVSSAGKRSDLDRCVEDIRAGVKKQALWEAYPKTLIRYEKAIDRAIDVLGPKPEVVVYPLESFEFLSVPEFVWEFSWILWGEAGIGKTCYAKAILPRALFVSHPDDLVRYDADLYDGLIFDDMSFVHIPRTGQIHLVDIDEPRSIHCRYQCARIPANTKKIFTTNEMNGLIVDLNDAAIGRRVKTFRLEK